MIDVLLAQEHAEEEYIWDTDCALYDEDDFVTAPAGGAGGHAAVAPAPGQLPVHLLCVCYTLACLLFDA